MQSGRNGDRSRNPRMEQGQRLAEHAEEMAVQLELVKLADEELPLGVAYTRFLDLVHRAIQFEHGTLYITEWGNGRLVPVALRGNRIDLADQVRFARGNGLSAWVAQEGRPVVIPDPRSAGERSPFSDEALRAFLAFPLVQNGLVAGVLALARGTRTFTPDEFERLGRLSESLSGSLSRLRRTARLRELVYQDPHTGLGNYHHFMARIEEELQRARQHAVEFTIAVVELAGLPEVERALGSQTRAHLLQSFTQRLQGSLRSCDVAAAISDGRWGLLLAGVNGDRATGVADRIIHDVERDNLQIPQQYRLAVRIGLADCVEPGSSAQALIDRAAMDMEIRK